MATEPGNTASNNTPGPVITAGAVQAVLGALAALGWLNLDSTTVAAVATAVAALIAAVVVVYGRRQVTPVSNPKDATGAPLVPVGSAQATPRRRASPCRCKSCWPATPRPRSSPWPSAWT
jgi:hypothetical protein